MNIRLQECIQNREQYILQLCSMSDVTLARKIDLIHEQLRMAYEEKNTDAPGESTSKNKSSKIKNTEGTEKIEPLGHEKMSSSSAKVKSNPSQSKSKSNSVKVEGEFLGNDAKGRKIYEGPRGGQYYINGNGNKTYLTDDEKIK